MLDLASLLRAALAGFAVLGLGWIGFPFVRNRSAAFRRSYLRALVLSLFVVSAVALFVPRRFSLRVSLPRAVMPAPVATADPVVAPVELPLEPSTTTGAVPVAPATIAPLPSPRATASPLGRTALALSCLWAIVAAALLLRIARDLVRARRFMAEARSVDDQRMRARFAATCAKAGVSNGIRLLVHPRATVPMTGGVLAPAVLLPPRWGAMSDEQLDTYLLHELEHVRARDVLFHLFAQSLVALHWFDPLAWITLRRLETERELAADDCVLQAGVRPSSLAHSLVVAAEVAEESRVHTGALAVITKSGLSQRVSAALATADRRRVARLASVCLALGGAVVASAVSCVRVEAREDAPVETTPKPSRAAIEARVEKRVRPLLPQGRPGALVIGIVQDDTENVFAWGPTAGDNPAKADGDTVFEIGSITEVFNGLAMATMVGEGKVALEEPVQKYLPGVRLAKKGPRDITLLDLADHTSGLPPFPTNFIVQDRSSSIPSYPVEMFYEFLSTYVPETAPGEKFLYSFTGPGLLGHALSLYEGKTYAAWMRARVLDPLGLHDTGFYDSGAKLRDRLAIGYEKGVAVQPRTDSEPTLGACCAARTTAKDLLKLVRANLAPDESSLRDAILLTQIPHAPAWSGERAGVGWGITDDGLLIKRGGNAGYQSIVVVDRKLRRGVVILASFSEIDRDTLATELLRDLSLASAPAPTMEGFSTTKIDAVPAGVAARSVDLEHTLRFLGARVDPAAASPGSKVRVSYYFQVLRAPDGDWRLFVHGEQVPKGLRIRADHYPSAPLRSTEAWQPGDVIEDSFVVDIPADYPHGALTLWTGLFRNRSPRWEEQRMKLDAPGDGDGANRFPAVTLVVE
jgi:D-alanyl-D-alanine-carboxypeptidase/D-alanyl-D-alanine-endopeptidase